MIRKLWLAAAVFISIGCQSDASITSSSAKKDETLPVEFVGLPNTLIKTELAIFPDRGHLNVGDSWETAIEIFKPPKNSFDFSDLPPRFKNPPYRARGWDSRTESFGVIMAQGRIAAAMYQLPKSDLDQLNELVNKHRRALLPLVASHVQGRHAQYWIWSKGTQRLAIVGLESQNTVRITIALGDNIVMDALELSERDAARDSKQVDEFFDSKLPKGTTSPGKDLH